jgi:uncharacterized protein
MITRRNFLRLVASLAAVGASTAAYGIVIEPLYRLRVTRYGLTPPDWPAGLTLRIAVVSDLHICEPWMDVARVSRIVAKTNAIGADIILLPGDFVATHRFQTAVPMKAWAAELGKLSAPLGVHAVLGNHDWWSDSEAMKRGGGPTKVGTALTDAGIRVYENDALRLEKDGRAFWLAGLGDQIAFVALRGWRAPRIGVADLPATMAKITDDAPVVLMVHEPDIFPRVSNRVAVTIAGHTHGGQVAPFGWRPIVPSRFGTRYAYGHIVEENRNLIVSSGLGCSVLPVRMGAPPEIVLIDLGHGGLAQSPPLPAGLMT